MSSAPASGAPLRILLACARPLISTSLVWEVRLTEPAARHISTLAGLLQDVPSLGGFSAEGRSIRFELHEPGPPLDFIRKKLSALPIESMAPIRVKKRIDVVRPGEELQEISAALAGLRGVELYVHPAVTPGDLRLFLQTHEVDVLHLSMHGDELGGLYFEDGRGSASRISPQELAHHVGGRAHLLFTGSCYSAAALSALFGENANGAGRVPAAIAVDGDHPIPAARWASAQGPYTRAAARPAAERRVPDGA